MLVRLNKVNNWLLGQLKRITPLTGASAPISETKASYTIQTALKLISKLAGTSGNGANNGIAVKATTSADDTLRVVLTQRIAGVSPYIIDIQLANTTSSKNTVALIRSAIVANTDVNNLVVAMDITSTTVVTPFAQQNLTGGLDGTPGAYGDVIIDNTGVKWTFAYQLNSHYYWSPDSFPENDKQYVSHYSPLLGKVVFKQRFTGTTPASNADTTIYTNVWATSVLMEHSTGQLNSGAGNLLLPTPYIYTTMVANIYAKHYFYRVAIAEYASNNANYLSKPFYLDVYFVQG